ncbi:amidohydrolase family protein [Blastomonas sp.]|uniref:amidohydrolase family protein n=1 Tax=Blastomonas sp. TaxID=1909299 RepID=UPI0026339130|nr:amidohydrolase family protein [Blastomonas sp.]MDM7956663.1 amidohydrolase family protein [Blastomonas sp.]
MSDRFDLIVRNIRLADSPHTSLAIRDGRVAEIGCDRSALGPELDGQRATMLPGLVDHHLHLLATAAQMQSVDLSGSLTYEAVRDKLHRAVRGLDAGTWLRATGYDERAAGLLDAAAIDQWVCDRPVRIQDRTGALWVLNGAGLARIGDAPYPQGVETSPDGVPTGRIWRCDDWLRSRIGSTPPSLARLGMSLLRYGITGVTDAGADNGPPQAGILAAAVRSGALPQRLTVMGREDLPASTAYKIGALKLLYDETDWPDTHIVAARIVEARRQGRNVAAHCTTAAELVLYLAALEESGGARTGDRIEHGSMIPHSMIPDIARAGLTVVTQPGFVHDRGDRYLAQIPAHEIDDLYRLSSLRDAGVALAAGSDAPYASVSPWIGIAAAQNRLTRHGARLGAAEAISAREALALYSPGGLKGVAAAPRISVGQNADLCLVALNDSPQTETIVRATIIGGNVFEPNPDAAELTCKTSDIQ